MDTARCIRCAVIAVPVSAFTSMSRGALGREVLPWADPYIAQLIRKLQDEVRQERQNRSSARYDSRNYGDSAAFSTSDRISAAR